MITPLGSPTEFPVGPPQWLPSAVHGGRWYEMTTGATPAGRNRPPQNPTGTQVNRNGPVNAVAPADTVEFKDCVRPGPERRSPPQP